jgi:hypothetical protein
MSATALFASVKSFLGCVASSERYLSSCNSGRSRAMTTSCSTGACNDSNPSPRRRRITVYGIGLKQRIAMVRLATGPQFYFEQFLLADQYVAEVLSDLLRNVINIAAHHATGTVRVDFATPNTREEIARVDLSAVGETLPSFALGMVMTAGPPLEQGRRWPMDFFGELRQSGHYQRVNWLFAFDQPTNREVAARTTEVPAVAKPARGRQEYRGSRGV